MSAEIEGAKLVELPEFFDQSIVERFLMGPMNGMQIGMTQGELCRQRDQMLWYDTRKKQFHFFQGNDRDFFERQEDGETKRSAVLPCIPTFQISLRRVFDFVFGLKKNLSLLDSMALKMHLPVVVLPQPDSPTRPKTFSFAVSKLTPSTAFKTPSSK